MCDGNVVMTSIHIKYNVHVIALILLRFLFAFDHSSKLFVKCMPFSRFVSEDISLLKLRIADT